MTDPLTAADLDTIEQRANAATEGPWEYDGGGEITQHFSLPEPWAMVVSTDVACMAYCYGGSAAGVERDEDAEFIAHARDDVPALLAEVRRLRAMEQRVREYARHLARPFADGVEGEQIASELLAALDGGE